MKKHAGTMSRAEFLHSFFGNRSVEDDSDSNNTNL